MSHVTFNPPWIHLSSVSCKPPDIQRKKSANRHWTDTDSLGICHKTAAQTSNYISHESVYLEKPESVCFTDNESVLELRISICKHAQSSEGFIFGFSSRLSSPWPGIVAGWWQPDAGIILSANGIGSSQGEAEYSGQSRSESGVISRNYSWRNENTNNSKKRRYSQMTKSMPVDF